MSKWIDLETDASTGKPYLWKCDECGEEVETRWNYCPECGDPKTSKGKSINTLVKALEAEHKKLREMQSATDKNVGTKYDELEIVRAIDGLSEWQKHVQTDSNIDRDITVAIEALKAQLGTNLAEVGMDTIKLQLVRLDCCHLHSPHSTMTSGVRTARSTTPIGIAVHVGSR